MSVLAPELKTTIGWDDGQFGFINAAFPLAYAIGFLMVGWLLDRFGTRLVYAGSLFFWSLAAMGHAFARTPQQFMAARFFLGLTESGNFPSAIKATSEWFPRGERALATGIFNAGSNVGALLAPAIVPYIYLHWGWQTAFVATGLVGLTWIAFWLPLYREPELHPRLCRGVGLDSKRADRAGRQGSLAAITAISADLGICSGEVFDRCRVVVLLVLVPDVHERYVRCGYQTHWTSHDHGVSHGRCRFRCRRVAVILDVVTRFFGQCRTQDGHAHLRDLCDAGVHGAFGCQSVDGGRFDRRGNGRPSGIFRQSLHAHERYVPQASGRIGRRDWRVCRRLEDFSSNWLPAS